MNTSKIEWLRDPITGKAGYTINPVKGACPVGCSYCYARRMYVRFNWNPAVIFDWSVANDLGKMKPGSRVFWGSTMELFGDWVDPEWMRLIMEAVKRHSDLTHIFLTKRPENLIKWSPFPENCWVGVSAVHRLAFWNACHYLASVKATVKFISFEPIQETMMGNAPENLIQYHLENAGVKWVIVGQETPVKKRTIPNIRWVDEISETAWVMNIPLFLKNNLNSCEISDYPMLLDTNGNLRQEYPVRDRRNQ